MPRFLLLPGLKRAFVIPAALIALVANPSFAPAQQNLSQPAERVGLRLCSVWPDPARKDAGSSGSRFIYDVEVQGQHAYVADGRGLQVLDVSDAKAPKAVARVETPGAAKAVRLSGQRAYVVDAYCPDGAMSPESEFRHGLFIFDISQPTRPKKLNADGVTGHNHFSCVAIAGNWAYLVDHYLYLADISDPVNPRLRGQVESVRTPCVDICIVGRWAYVVEGMPGTIGPAGLGVYDLTDPANPIRTGGCESQQPSGGSSPWPSCVDVAGTYAYLGGWDGALRIVDVSEPTKPTEVGKHQGKIEIFSVQAARHRVFLADGEGVKVVDVTRPTDPVLVGQYALKGQNRRVRVVGNFAYVCALTNLVILEIKATSNQ